MSSIKSVKSLTLDLPPSCIEFWPQDPQYAIVGTYNLEKQDGQVESAERGEDEGEKKSQSRNGSLVLLSVNDDNVKIVQTLLTLSAILDIHFGPGIIPRSIFGAATSTGSIGIYELENDSPQPRIIHIRTIQYFPEDILVTAFAWHPAGTAIGATLSSGQLSLGKFNIENETEHTSIDILVHDLEAWTLAFHSDGSGVYSGGDDSALQFTGLATNVEHQFDESIEAMHSETRRMPWKDQRIHGAGVTAILPLHSTKGGDYVITGSYDDHIRLIHAPLMGRRRVLTELNLGGGVWRLKLLNRKPQASFQQGGPLPEEVLLLVSCMHAGTRIVKLIRGGDSEWSFEVLAKFEEHQSMNYGSDSRPDVNAMGQYTFVTTSFYDRLLCLWRY